ncbi:anti-repressor SinI family protein [Bacillus multifaciens]|nr:anti-repressor SinI family protein [Bacillus sp. WLY-B-L8]MDP7977707.1 anti-repressor SinI family protein [Bacillus sp. WLY-B-L8]HDX9588152.1 anti-repressor SinI family protein [Bacillus pseudomycoides]
MQTDNKEILDSEWIDLLLEALDMNMTSAEVSNFLKHGNQRS